MARGKGHNPVRTCIVCRARKGKDELIRYVLDPSGGVRRDDRGDGFGRGAYVCPDKACQEGLMGRGRLERAFRRKKVIR